MNNTIEGEQVGQDHACTRVVGIAHPQLAWPGGGGSGQVEGCAGGGRARRHKCVLEQAELN